MAPPKVTQWVNENFPKPRVDPEWLNDCCEWLIGNQHIDPLTSFPEFTDQVKGQLLESDLRDSMMHGTGLDVHVDKFTGNLKGPPILVQIIAITDTGVSAYQLEQVRAAREEHMLSGVDKEGDEDGDVDIEGEGPMPKYPRGSLRLRLSDGVTKLEAMEYRPLPQISLGPTPLGYKLQLKGTLIRNGMAFLEPSTVVFLGGSQEQLEARQLEDFKRGLRVRLGLPVEDEPEVPALAAAPAPARPAAAAAARSPLRDISPPSPPLCPQHDDDMSLGARRRRVPELSSTSTTISASSSRNISGNIQGRPIIGLPRGRKSNASTTSNGNKSQPDEPELDLEIEERQPSATERSVLTSTAASQNTTSSHFNKNIKCDPYDFNVDVENLDFNLSPTTRQSTRLYRPPSPSTSFDIPLSVQTQERQDNSFDFDLLDEIDPDENQPPLKQQTQQKKASSFATLPPSRDLKGKGRAKPSSGSLLKADDASSDDYGMMGIDENDFADADFLANLSRVETEALTSGGDVNESQVSNARGVDSSLMSMGGSSGSFVVVEGDKKSSSSRSGSAPIPFSSSTKATERLEIIEIDSSDDEMLDTGDKENEPVATRHVKRRTEDLDAGARERGRELVASQGWNPGSGGARKIGGGLGTQNQNQNRTQKGSQDLKSQTLVLSSEVIDLLDSDDE